MVDTSITFFPREVRLTAHTQKNLKSEVFFKGTKASDSRDAPVPNEKAGSPLRSVVPRVSSLGSKALDKTSASP